MTTFKQMHILTSAECRQTIIDDIENKSNLVPVDKDCTRGCGNCPLIKCDYDGHKCSILS